MSLKKRLQKRVRNVYDATQGKVADFGTKIGHRVSDAAKRTGEKAREGYQRYKDPLAIGLINALGIALAIPTGGASLAAAGFATSAYTGARQAHLARKEERATRQAERDFDAQTSGLENAGGLSPLLRRRRLQRGAGDAVASYESDTARGGIDEQEIAA